VKGSFWGLERRPDMTKTVIFHVYDPSIDEGGKVTSNFDVECQTELGIAIELKSDELKRFGFKINKVDIIGGRIG